MPEYITTRVYYSKKLDEQTYAELTLIAKRLGILRKIIWHQFSSNPKRLKAILKFLLIIQENAMVKALVSF